MWDMIKSVEDYIKFIAIVFLLFIVSLYRIDLLHMLSLVVWILLLGAIGLSYQLIFPEIPLKIGRILAYSFSIVLFLITLTFISNEKFIDIVIIQLANKITTKEISVSHKIKNNKIRETNGSK